MRFALIKTPEALTYYGDVPEPPLETNDTAEVFTFDLEDRDLLVKDFAYPAYRVCGALLDYGDVDYLDAKQCETLCPWLSGRMERSCPDRLRTLYGKLSEFSGAAVQLGTGVVIEL